MQLFLNGDKHTVAYITRLVRNYRMCCRTPICALSDKLAHRDKFFVRFFTSEMMFLYLMCFCSHL